MSNAPGLDGSNNNAQPFDWHAYPDIAFAAWKLGEGPHDGQPVYLDPTFAENWAAMREVYGNKLVRFAYWFGHPSSDPVEQADTLTSVARANGLQYGDGFWLDLEPYPGLTTPDGLPPADVAWWAQRFCERVNRNCPHLRCLVYCDPSTAQLGCCHGLQRWPLALADYNPEPQVPLPWKDWTIWQSSDSGTVDRDQFNGDRQALYDFAGMPADRR